MVLPMVVIFYDLTVQKMVNRYEYIFMFVLKGLWTVAYWVLMSTTYILTYKDIIAYDIENPIVDKKDDSGRLLSHPQKLSNAVDPTNDGKSTVKEKVF